MRTVEDTVLGNTMSYRYDRQHQLVSAQSSATMSLAKVHGLLGPQTVAGNAQARMMTRAVAHDYDSTTQLDSQTVDPGAVHQLVGLDTGSVDASFAYDKEGNRTRRTVGSAEWDYHYDADGKLLMAETAGGSQREVYLYDINNQRVLAYRDGFGDSDKVVRQWFGSDELWHGPDGSVTRAEVHVSAGATPIARIVNGNLDNVEFTYNNGLGHLLAAVDMAEESVAEFHYGPFGELLASSGGKKDQFRRRFQGKEDDELTGLSYFGYRYYDKLTLTWTQMDPLYRLSPDYAWDEPRRGVLYGFVVNNPLRYVDPDGRDIADFARGFYDAAAGAAAAVVHAPVAVGEYAARIYLDPVAVHEEQVDSVVGAIETTERAGRQVKQLATDKDLRKRVRKQVKTDVLQMSEEDWGRLGGELAWGVVTGMSGGGKFTASGGKFKGRGRVAKTSYGKRVGDFTPSQKRKAKAQNAAENGGTIACTDCRRDLRSVKSEKGVSTPPDQAQVHHDPPLHAGGSRDSKPIVVCPECHNQRHRNEAANK